MKRLGVSLKTFGLIALFFLYAILQLSHGIITFVNSQVLENNAVKEKSGGTDKLQNQDYKKELPFNLSIDKGHIVGNPLMYWSF